MSVEYASTAPTATAERSRSQIVQRASSSLKRLLEVRRYLLRVGDERYDEEEDGYR